MRAHNIRHQGASIALALTLTALWAGCAPSTTPRNPTDNATDANRKASFRAALVLDKGGIDDKSFNAAAWDGMQRAIRELGIDGKYVESVNESVYKTNLSRLAQQGYNVVIAVGFAMEDALNAVAPQFPDVTFAIIDGNAPALPNCAALKFKEEEGAFLVGFLAASMSKTRVIGFVGGMEIPLIKKFEAGYRAGARTANPDVQVKATYTGDWEDLNKGKSQAEQLFGNGADIIFHGAGKCGVGVIRAAEARGNGFYAIGVDKDQDGEAPGHVLTSMIKRVDNAVFETIRAVKENRFTPGEQIFGLKQGGVGLSEMKYTRDKVPPAVLEKLKKLEQKIIRGEITIPTRLEDLPAFRPPEI